MRENNSEVNHPYVVWAACFLWLVSVFAITWALLLFFYVGDVLIIMEADFVIALVLLSGIMMLPANVYMLYSIAHGTVINYDAKVMCCQLWLCILCIIIVNAAGAIMCSFRIHNCIDVTSKFINTGMREYRSVPRYKHFIDNLQWALKCCGLDSYKDWFKRDWYDKIRDYEWDSVTNRRQNLKHEASLTDSVPLSCCRSGSCISNYLLEMGTQYIYTGGCSKSVRRMTRVSMIAHLIMFISVIVVETVLLRWLIKNKKPLEKGKRFMNTEVRQILSVKNFDASSGSYQMNSNDEFDVLAEEMRK